LNAKLAKHAENPRFLFAASAGFAFDRCVRF